MLKMVEGMPLQPYTCLTCGQGPTDNDGNVQKVIFAEGVDIDWGNSVYICYECGELMADLMGRATRWGFDELTQKYEKVKAEYDELLDEHEKQEVLLDKIREGNAAQKQIRSKAA